MIRFWYYIYAGVLVVLNIKKDVADFRSGINNVLCRYRKTEERN